MEEYLTKDIVYPGKIFLGVFVFSKIEMVMTNWYNRISCRPILSVIILVINKSDSRFVVRFC